MRFTSLSLPLYGAMCMASLVACAGAGAVPEALRHEVAQRSDVAEDHSIDAKSGSDAVSNEFREALESFGEIRLGDLSEVQAALKTTFSDADNVHGLIVRKSDRGVLGRIGLRNVEWRTGADNDGSHVLLFTLEAPGAPFRASEWSEAIPHPPDPDARGSKGYWTMRMNGRNIVLGLDEEETHIVQISIRDALNKSIGDNRPGLMG